MLAKTLCLSVVLCAIFSGSASATIYSNAPAETPFDITLDTGSNSWSGSPPTLQSTDETVTSNHATSSSAVTFEVDETPAQVGVPGVVDIYQVNTTTTTAHDHTYNDQTARISYNASLTDLQQTPQEYVFSGTIEKQTGETLYNNNGWLSFNMGMG